MGLFRIKFVINQKYKIMKKVIIALSVFAFLFAFSGISNVVTDN